MTDFTFTADPDSDDAQQTTFNFSAEPRLIREPTKITYTLTQAELDYCWDLAEKRAQSYNDGRTSDKATASNLTNDEAHIQGVKAEYVVSKVYGGSVDESISAKGDDGKDLTFEIDGTLCDVDVKCTSWDPAHLKLQSHKTHVADAYFVCYSPSIKSKRVEIQGWATHDEAITNNTTVPARGGNWWENYQLTEKQYRSPPAVYTGGSYEVE